MSKINLYKRKDGSFEVRVYSVTDKSEKTHYRSFCGKTSDEAINKAFSGEMTSGEYFSEEPMITVSEIVIEWLEAVSVRVKKSTLSNYRMKAEKHVLPAFGNYICSELTTRMINSFIHNKLNLGLSVRYVSDILVMMKSVFRYAHKVYNIKNVFDGIIMPKSFKADVKLLSDTELLKLKKHLVSKNDLTSIGILMSLLTGLRIGELCALKWEDIDLNKRMLTVNKTIQRIQCSGESPKTKLVITAPKSESSVRIIPIPQCLVQALLCFFNADENYFLSGTDKPIEPRTLQYRFAGILKTIGLPPVHFHSLRHSFSTNAIALGFDIKTLSELLGHSSVEITLNRYVHSSMERKRAYMDMIKITV